LKTFDSLVSRLTSQSISPSVLSSTTSTDEAARLWSFVSPRWSRPTETMRGS
jgi:hypothetical protein